MSFNPQDMDWKKEIRNKPLDIVLVLQSGEDITPLKKRLGELLPGTVPEGLRLEINFFAKLTNE